MIPPTPIAPARRAAFDILRKIGRDRGNSDTLLHSIQVDLLSQQDRNLCTTLKLCVRLILEQCGSIDCFAFDFVGIACLGNG